VQCKTELMQPRLLLRAHSISDVKVKYMLEYKAIKLFIVKSIILASVSTLNAINPLYLS
jgi:hypothetical protein